jgi:hypothetical protein
MERIAYVQLTRRLVTLVPYLWSVREIINFLGR